MELQFSYFFAYLDIHQTETSYKDAATGKNICTVRDAPKTQKGIRSAEIPADASWIVPRIKEMTPADSKWLFMTRKQQNEGKESRPYILFPPDILPQSQTGDPLICFEKLMHACISGV